ncbi:MAG: hypothetical protein JW913_05545 [Chitinispirillaceae bacterium]|nr:hypothetical protein [Chitinispirillaceae bacterium]
MSQNCQSPTEHTLHVETFNEGWSDPVQVPAGELHRFIIKRGSLLTVKIVDETGAPVEGVPLIFRGAGASETVPTDGDGVAKCATITAESVEVTFESAETVNKTMAAVWQSREATPEAEYAQADCGTVAVVSRPGSIETPEGEAFSPLSVEAGTPKTISVRPGKNRAYLIEMPDVLLRTDSAVVLPEGEAPTDKEGEHESLTSVGIIATLLRYNEEHEGKMLFVAGHADKAGNEGDNVKLSEHRANAVLALIEGNRQTFIDACIAKHSEADVTQLFDWTNRQYGFTCKPTVMDRAPSDENYVRFRSSFNKWVAGPPEEGEADSRGTEINDYGRLQPDIWGAMFDLYAHNLRGELGEKEAGVNDLRGKLVWVDGSNKTIGFGEKHPTKENTIDGTRSQEDRRVEVFLFDEKEKPDLAATNGEDVYDGETYEKTPVEPMVSAKKWTAMWEVKKDPETGEEMPARMDETRNMIIEAPGLVGEKSMEVKVYQIINDKEEQVTATKTASADAVGGGIPFGGWYNPELVQKAGSGSLPYVKFRFEVKASSRTVSSGILPYGDTLELRVLYGQSSDWTPPDEQKYCIHSPWGQRSGRSIEWNGENGWIRELNLPPGGISLVLGERYLFGANV